jgi:hypothetical protein
MTWTWLTLVALGAGHGLNPGMGWLFAVALGMQEGRTRAVWRALSPLALGHALAVGAAVLAAAALGHLLPEGALKWIVAAMLLSLGVTRLVRHRHPRYGGMRVGFRELTTWSFLMATAHGAGLMVVPFVRGAWAGTGGGAGEHGAHMGHAAHAMSLMGSTPAAPGPQLMQAAVVPMVSGPLAVGIWAAVMHSLGYLLVTGVIAVVVYRRLGLRMLSAVWINLDLIWGAALVVTGAVAAAA